MDAVSKEEAVVTGSLSLCTHVPRIRARRHSLSRISGVFVARVRYGASQRLSIFDRLCVSPWSRSPARFTSVDARLTYEREGGQNFCVFNRFHSPFWNHCTFVRALFPSGPPLHAQQMTSRHAAIVFCLCFCFRGLQCWSAFPLTALSCVGEEGENGGGALLNVLAPNG